MRVWKGMEEFLKPFSSFPGFQHLFSFFSFFLLKFLHRGFMGFKDRWWFVTVSIFCKKKKKIRFKLNKGRNSCGWFWNKREQYFLPKRDSYFTIKYHFFARKLFISFLFALKNIYFELKYIFNFYLKTIKWVITSKVCLLSKTCWKLSFFSEFKQVCLRLIRLFGLKLIRLFGLKLIRLLWIQVNPIAFNSS